MEKIRHITVENWKFLLKERRKPNLGFNNIMVQVNQIETGLYQLKISYSQDWNNMDDFIEAFDHLLKD